jgi:PAS domain S-box-containing protein
MDAIVKTPSREFLAGDGEMARLIGEFDWSLTPMGPIAGWPQVVKSTLALILRSPLPIVTLWGETGVMLYNDAYAEFAGARHPDILGMDVLDAWPEAIDWNRKVMETAFHRGETLSVQDLELMLYRNGIGEPVWMNLDYSPVPNEDGTPAAVIAIVVETTAKVRAEQRLSGERERLKRMFDQAPGFMALLEGPDHVFVMANRAYFELVGGRDVVGKPVLEAVPEVADQGFIDVLDGVYRTGEPFVGSVTSVRLLRGDGKQDERFLDFIFQPVLSDGEIAGIFIQGHDVTDRMRFERHQQLLVGELNHRVKNTLAIVQSLTHQSFHSSVPAAEAIHRFEGRLEALASAHNLLTRKNWDSATIAEVAQAALAAFGSEGRVDIDGPDVRVSPPTAVSLALALHELATNAAKYGALSNHSGRVCVRWTVADGRLRLEWREQGGPPVIAPDRRGFGTRMIQRTLASEFGGEVDLEFRPDGVACTVEAPLPTP